MSNVSKTSNDQPGSTSERANDHQKGDTSPAHRNATLGAHHHRGPNAPKDVEEFIEGQIRGKQNEQELMEKFPTDETVWHGFVNVSRMAAW
jgi:hypothetical protein